ncbi:MAG: HlyC/CorC family transporter [Planctomycetota bacterium]|nr:MAG: HlyC/CorC family transporter [Planctomycetota bacterium]
MAQVYQNIGHITLMLLLLVGSAFFSGSETAFFSLSRRQINLLKKSRHKLQNLAAALLKHPKQLLSCLLFGNMIVNVFFFALASVLTVRIEQQVGPAAAAVTAFFAFCLLVLLGEILPKSLAYTASKPLSVAAALPAFLCVKVFRPVVFVFRFLVVELALRLLLGPVQHPKPITTGEFQALMEQVRKRGLITTDESRLFTEVIELGFLKVRDCLQPRVDMSVCAVTDSAHKARQIMLKNNLTKLPVYAGTIDNIIGMVHLRELLLDPDANLDKLVRKVDFVPEQKTVESLLEFFRKTATDTAIVVDEYGGIAGSICLEDVAEELLGPIELAGGVEPIEQIGPFEYRLAGNLAIHDWAGAFGIEPAQTRLATIAGLVTAALGKIPKAGDIAYLKNLKFTVERVRKHRIETLILSLQQTLTDDK